MRRTLVRSPKLAAFERASGSAPSNFLPSSASRACLNDRGSEELPLGSQGGRSSLEAWLLLHQSNHSGTVLVWPRRMSLQIYDTTLTTRNNSPNQPCPN